MEIAPVSTLANKSDGASMHAKVEQSSATLVLPYVIRTGEEHKPWTTHTSLDAPHSMSETITSTILRKFVKRTILMSTNSHRTDGPEAPNYSQASPTHHSGKFERSLHSSSN